PWQRPLPELGVPRTSDKQHAEAAPAHRQRHHVHGDADWRGAVRVVTGGELLLGHARRGGPGGAASPFLARGDPRRATMAGGPAWMLSSCGGSLALVRA